MNLPTFLVAAVVAAVFLAILFCGYRRRKKGKPSCSCGGCAGCSLSGTCGKK